MLARTDGQTTFVTCTKRGAAAINDLAVQVLFRNRNRCPVDNLPADYEDNAENDDERASCEDRAPPPNTWRSMWACAWFSRGTATSRTTT